MIPDEIERLIYQCIMGGKVVVIAPNDELASERFEEIRKAVVVAADEVRMALEKTEREIICGLFPNLEPNGIFAELLEQIKAVQIDAEVEKEWAQRMRFISRHFTQRLRNNYRKLHALPLKRRPRCRWRQRESRRRLEGLSPEITIIDEYAIEEE